EPLDAAIVDDRHVYHGVTAIEPEVPGEAAHRDVLVVTWRAEG
ncbi:MAG: 2OG-Fe dioxygenase family protein, partial [Hyphomicrobiaceae bacterium]